MVDKNPKVPTVSSPADPAKERRYLPRWEINNRVLYCLDGQPLYKESFSKDISSDGASFYIQESLGIGQKLSLILFLTEYMAVYVQARVQWQQPFGEKFLIGSHFEDIAEKVQEIILEQAFAVNPSAMKKNWFEGWNKL